MKKTEIKEGKYTLSQEKAKKIAKIIYAAHNGDLDQISNFCMTILQTIMNMKESKELEILSVNENTGSSARLKMEIFK